jgi:hypothetical protein
VVSKQDGGSNASTEYKRYAMIFPPFSLYYKRLRLHPFYISKGIAVSSIILHSFVKYDS